MVKTVVMEDDQGRPLIVLMHGDRQASTNELARTTGAKSITPHNLRIANNYTDYQVGEVSLSETRKGMPVYMESSILRSPRIDINGGRRGYLINMCPAKA